MSKKKSSLDEQRHLLNTYAPTFLAACNLLNLVPHNSRQFICPFCGNGSGEDGTGVDFEFVKESGEYRYHCFKCQRNFDNVEIAQKVLDQPFIKAIREAMNILDGKSYFEGIQPEFSADVDTTPKVEEPLKDYSAAYKIWQDKLSWRLDDGNRTYRGLTLATLQKFGVGYANDWGEPPTPRIIIPYNKNHYLARYDGTDEMLQDPKYKDIRPKQHSKGVKPIFNLDRVIAIRKNDEQTLFDKEILDSRGEKYEGKLPHELGDPIFVVEGEIDAMTGYQLTKGKFQFVALGGCEITRTTSEDLKACAKFPSSVFIVLLDNDRAGNAAKYKVAQALIELGHYAIIGNLAKIKSSITRTVKLKESDGKIRNWEYSINVELMPLEGYNRKHCKDLNDTLQKGCWSEARAVLAYLGGIGTAFSEFFGNLYEGFVWNYADLHGELKPTLKASLIHDYAADFVKEMCGEMCGDEKLFTFSDGFFDLFEIPTENAHLRFKDLNFKITKPLITAPTKYVPYFMENHTTKDGKSYSTIKGAKNPIQELDEEIERELHEVDKMSEEKTETAAQNEVADEQSASPPQNDESNSTEQKPFTPITIGGDDNDGNIEPEEQTPPASQPAQAQTSNSISHFTKDVIETCPINLRIPPLYRFMTFGIVNRDSGDLISYVPVVPTKMIVEAETGIHYTELAFYDKFFNVWTSITVEDKVLADPNELLKLNSNGLVFTKKNSKSLSNFLIEIRDSNLKEIPHEALYTTPGWLDEKCTEFLYPNSDNNGKTLRTQGNFWNRKFEKKGSYEDWRDRVVRLLKTTDRGKPLGILFFLFGVALSAPVLRFCGGRNIQTYLWCQSGSGKSALVKMIMSIYGRPEGLKQTFNGTYNALNDLPKYYNDLPVWIDEYQSAPKSLRDQMSQFIYGFELGKGRMRLDKTSAMRKIEEFKGVRFMTGEQPMFNESVDAGAKNRMLSISAKDLFPRDYDLSEHHNFFDSNFGFFGEIWIRYISKPEVQAEFDRLLAENKVAIREIAQTQQWTNNWADVCAIILTCLQIGLPLLDPTFFPSWTYTQFCLAIDELYPDIPKLTSFTNSQRALVSLEEYINSHPRRFMVETTVTNENGGKYTQLVMSGAGNALEEQGYIFKDGSVGITQTEIRNILERELGFGSYESILRGWRDEEKIKFSPNDTRNKYSILKRMPKPFSQSRRLVVFPPQTLEIEIVPSSGKYLIDSNNHDDEE